MPEFDPEKGNGWSLREAIMRAGNLLLAAVAQKRLELGKQPPWWMPQLAPEPFADKYFRYDYLDPQRDFELTVRAVETAFRIALINGELVCWARPGAPHESHKKMARGAWGALVVEDWIFGTLRACTRDAHMDFVPVPDGPRYYDARIEPPLSRRPVSEHEIEEWLSDHPDLSERDAIAEAPAYFGCTVPRSRIRAARQKLNIRLEAGRRSGNCAGK